MAQQFYKKADGTLAVVDDSKIRVYKHITDAEAALADGTLKEGEVFATVENTVWTEDIAARVYRIEQDIPADTSETNQLVNQSQLATATGDISTIENDIVDIKTDITCLQTFKADTSALQTLDNTLSNAIACKVSCSDYNTNCTCQDNRLSALESCSGLSCTGTLVASDIAGKTDCTYSTGINTRVTNLESCSGLSCTGTLVASDISNLTACSYSTNLNTRLTAAENAITCLRTDLTTLQTTVSNLTTRVTALESCNGLNCQGTLTGSLSGTTLVITEA